MDLLLQVYKRVSSIFSTHYIPPNTVQHIAFEFYDNWFIMESDMELYDYDNKMDSSFDTSDSDDLADDADYGENLLSQLKQMNKKFKLACKQVVLMNNEIEYLQNRYDRAVQQSRRNYRYFLRLKIATIEGIRDMFYAYASQHADKLDALHEQLLSEGIIEEELDLDALNDGEV